MTLVNSIGFHLCLQRYSLSCIYVLGIIRDYGWNSSPRRRDALRILRESPVCAVIADHMLQGTTGMELAKHMKKIKPRIPVILFSGTAPQGLGGCLRQQGRTHRKVSSSVTLLSDFGRKLSV
jgi:CheY-like chemotaxis protein